MQIHLSKPNPCCIAWSRQQEALASTWTQTKRRTFFYREGVISILNGGLKLVYKFTFLCVSSTENYVNMQPWTANNRLSIIWKSNLSDEIKRKFDQKYYCMDSPHGRWQNTLKKKLDRNYTRMLRALMK